MSKALYAEFTAKPAQAPRVASLITEYARLVRQEPGNVVFDVYTKRDNASAFWIFEVYADDRAFEEHLRAPYGQPFNEALGPLIEEAQSVLTHLSEVEPSV